MTQPDATTTEATILAFPCSPERRLLSALRRLEMAQVEQAQALAGFRESLATLRDHTSRLQASVRGWQTSVRVLGDEAEHAQEASRRLSATAAVL